MRRIDVDSGMLLVVLQHDIWANTTLGSERQPPNGHTVMAHHLQYRLIDWLLLTIRGASVD